MGFAMLVLSSLSQRQKVVVPNRKVVNVAGIVADVPSEWPRYVWSTSGSINLLAFEPDIWAFLVGIFD